MEDPQVVYTPAATVQHGFHKKTMRQDPAKILYPKRKAMLSSTTVSRQREQNTLDLDSQWWEWKVPIL